MNGFHVKRVAEHKVNIFLRAQIGQPVPGKDALDGDYQVLPIGINQCQELFAISVDVLVQ